MAPPKLVTEFPAMKPQLVFSFNSYADVEKTWAKPIETIHHTAIALTEDAAMFQALGYHKTHTAAGEEFLRSLAYYEEVLILDSLFKMRSELQAYTFTPALTIAEPNHSIGSMLADASESCLRLSKIRTELLDAAGWKFHWKTPSTGDMVPTACPYQLLYQMISTKKLFSAPAGDQITRTFRKFHHPWLIMRR